MNQKEKDYVTILARNHWAYVKSVLVSHGVNEVVIAVCGHHYLTAFEHGFEHGIEHAEASQCSGSCECECSQSGLGDK